MEPDAYDSSIAFGRGAYSPPEAARLLGLTSQKLRRWVAGYEFKGRSGALRLSRPVVRPDLERIGGFIELTFLDVIELLFVRNFLKEGVSMRVIRKAAVTASEILHVERHPFCVQGFKTDGQRIFAQLKLEPVDLAVSERHLLDLASRQQVFSAVIAPFLRQFEYDLETDFVRRWWPLGRDKAVVIDPALNFGMPVVSGYGVPTRVLYALAASGKKLAAIADWYEIPVKAVKDAVSFESGLDA